MAYVAPITPAKVGVCGFITFLEHRHFQPGTAANKQMELYAVVWCAKEYIVLVAPRTCEEVALALLATLGLRAVKGVPTRISAEQGMEPFPINAPNMYTLDYVADHFALQDNPVELATAFRAERMAISREIEATLAKLIPNVLQQPPNN
jgi:hypothetical protein